MSARTSRALISEASALLRKANRLVDRAYAKIDLAYPAPVCFLDSLAEGHEGASPSDQPITRHEGIAS